MNNIWTYISSLGVNNSTDALLAKSIKTANRLNLILGSLSLGLFLLTVYFTLKGGDDFDFFTTRLLLLSFICAVSIFLAKKGKVKAMQLLTSFGPISVIIITPTLLGFVQSSSFFYYQIIIIGFSLIPHIVFVPRKNSAWYYFSVIMYVLLILVIDDLMINYADSNLEVISIIMKFKVYYKVIPLVIFIFLQLTLIHFRKINVEYEDNLLSTNEDILKKNKRILAQRDELRIAYNKLKETQNQLVQSEKMASLGVLASGVAHEINNPLNYIQGATTALESFFQEKEYIRTSDTDVLFNGLKVGVKRTADIVKGLNQFSRTSESFDENCDLHSILDNCLVMVQNKLKHRVEVERLYAEDLPYFKGNVGKLHQVFMNIFVNAIQAIPDKGKITIESSVSDNMLRVLTSDTGMGIKSELISKVIEPFFTTRDPGEGTGLGMAISYSIIQEHQGQLDIQSVEGSGTSVEVKLPIGEKRN